MQDVTTARPKDWDEVVEMAVKLADQMNGGEVIKVFERTKGVNFFLTAVKYADQLRDMIKHGKPVNITPDFIPGLLMYTVIRYIHMENIKAGKEPTAINRDIFISTIRDKTPENWIEFMQDCYIIDEAEKTLKNVILHLMGVPVLNTEWLKGFKLQLEAADNNREAAIND